MRSKKRTNPLSNYTQEQKDELKDFALAMQKRIRAEMNTKQGVKEDTAYVMGVYFLGKWLQFQGRSLIALGMDPITYNTGMFYLALSRIVELEALCQPVGDEEDVELSEPWMRGLDDATIAEMLYQNVRQLRAALGTERAKVRAA